MIRHMVFVRFRSDVSEPKRDAILSDLGDLRDVLEGVQDFRQGRNTSPETPVVHGFTRWFWFDFTDTAARDAYLADPGHQALGARLVEMAEGGPKGIFVCDTEL